MSSVDNTVIAREVKDPTYFRGGQCPRGRKCRYSDAALARYTSTGLSTRGVIAKTTGANNNSLEVSGIFDVTAQDNNKSAFKVDDVVNKIGRTTGWTQGKVTQTCVNTNVSGSNITQLCQAFVSAGVGGGDSGSPVFVQTGTNTATLIGILWGGSSSGGSFVFSPLNQIQQELGSFVATK